MKRKVFDVVTPKQYEANENGKVVKKTAWNRVGVAWPAKTPDTLSFELFLIPGVRYSISMKEKEAAPESSNKLDEVEL